MPASNNYKGGFGTSLMTKDLGLAQDAATRAQSATPLGSLAHQVEGTGSCHISRSYEISSFQIYRVMCNAGYAEKDFSSAFQFLKEQEKNN